MKQSRLRLHAICPYFAMFPETFVRKHVQLYSKKGDWVFDPFCGRGTTILEALLLDRKAAGTDINPVAYCVSSAKAEHPSLARILRRIQQLKTQYGQSKFIILKRKQLALPPFFRRAFYFSTLHELLFLREALLWREKSSDRFIAALILGSLHGEMDKSNAYFSNQMPRTICLKPDYSLRYWNRHKLYPKKRNVFDMLMQKASFRLNKLPACGTGQIKMTDVRKAAIHFKTLRKKISLVVTSPPYLNVTNYEEDQWLRLWFLGNNSSPTYGKISKDDRYNATSKYWQFLKEAWVGTEPLLRKSAKLVVRLGAIGLKESEMTNQLIKSIRDVYPKAHMVKAPDRSQIIHRQAKNFLPKSKGCLYEVDHVFQLS